MFALRHLQKLPKNPVYAHRKISQTSDLVTQNLPNSDEGITVFGFNRPQQKNSFGTKLVRELQNAIQKINFDTTARVLIVRSLVPGVFCAGET